MLHKDELLWDNLVGEDNNPRFPNNLEMRSVLRSALLEQLGYRDGEHLPDNLDEDLESISLCMVFVDTRNDFTSIHSAHARLESGSLEVYLQDDPFIDAREPRGEFALIVGGWMFVDRPNVIGSDSGTRQALGHWGIHDGGPVIALVISEDWTG